MSGPASAPRIAPRALWPAVRERAARALRSGVLAPIPTSCEVVPDAGIEFVVRVMAGRAARPRTLGPAAAAGTPDPFAPPFEPDLLVGAVTHTHVALLNRFPVLEEHVLLVTADYEPQEAPLTVADLEAAAVALAEGERLAFYNAGAEAGASQAHKHLQAVSLPLGPTRAPVPIEPALEEASPAPGPVLRSPRLPFRHAFARTAVGLDAERDHAGYASLLAAVGRDPADPGAYNWLATRRWMLVVPRVRAEAYGIEVNALGFAGALLVRDRTQLAALRARGPLSLLREVAEP